MVSWNRCASWVTTPMVSRIDASVVSRTSTPLMRIAPRLHVVEARDEVADRGLARARVTDQRDELTGSTVNETSDSTWWFGVWSSTATDSSDASDTSSARG